MSAALVDGIKSKGDGAFTGCHLHVEQRFRITGCPPKAGGKSMRRSAGLQGPASEH